jgi:predicted hydrocarbon binding protein
MSEEKRTDNFLMRTYLETIQSIVGINGLKSVLNYGHLEKYIDAFPPCNDNLEIPVRETQTLFCSLSELFGRKGVRSLQLQVGREIARNALEGLPVIAKALQVGALVLPESKKMRLFLDKLAEETEKRLPTQIELREEGDCFLYTDKDYFLSEHVVSETPVCDIFVGSLQYFMEWITGHPHHVEEIECRAMGHPADVFKISKKRDE